MLDVRCSLFDVHLLKHHRRPKGEDAFPSMTLRRSVPHLLALFLYSCLTLVMTYPAVLRLKVAIIGDYVDSFLNTWIIAWGIRKITRGEWGSLFDANIFFPYKNTLAYSEHLLGVALTAIPIQLGFNDPLVTFNVSVLISFVLTALGMYLLVWYLTRNGYAAFFSGLLFSFFPWRIGHIAHLQLLSAQWLPLTFLFLHKSVKSFSYRFFSGPPLFFILQFYSCGYYGLFLALFVVVFMVLALQEGETGRYRLLGRFGLFFLISFLVILPVYLPYWKLKKDFGFFRPFGEVVFFSADFASFLSIPIQNRLWGNLLEGFVKPEGDLFMGLIAGLMSLTGMWSLAQWKKYPAPPPAAEPSDWPCLARVSPFRSRPILLTGVFPNPWFSRKKIGLVLLLCSPVFKYGPSEPRFLCLPARPFLSPDLGAGNPLAGTGNQLWPLPAFISMGAGV